MQSGFLRPAAGPRHVEDEVQHGVSTQQAAGKGLVECLELLKGPSNERRSAACLVRSCKAPLSVLTKHSTCRLVGLLLVTRLLPAGDEAAILSVHQALGMPFLQRLLLPLTGQQARPLDSAFVRASTAASNAFAQPGYIPFDSITAASQA